MQVQSLGQEDLLEKGMATHSSILAWRIPWTEEPGRLQSIGSQSRTRLKRLSMHRGKIKNAIKYKMPVGVDRICLDPDFIISAGKTTTTLFVDHQRHLNTGC